MTRAGYLRRTERRCKLLGRPLLAEFSKPRYTTHRSTSREFCLCGTLITWRSGVRSQRCPGCRRPWSKRP